MNTLAYDEALYSQGLHAIQTLGVLFDGMARHTPEGYDFAPRAAEAGFKRAVRERDAPYED
jgi:enoyl-CoA hydratase